MFEEHPFGRHEPAQGNPDQIDNGPSVCRMSCDFEEGALADLVGSPEQKEAFGRMVATSALATLRAESINL